MRSVKDKYELWVTSRSDHPRHFTWRCPCVGACMTGAENFKYTRINDKTSHSTVVFRTSYHVLAESAQSARPILCITLSVLCTEHFLVACEFPSTNFMSTLCLASYQIQSSCSCHPALNFFLGIHSNHYFNSTQMFRLRRSLNLVENCLQSVKLEFL